MKKSVKLSIVILNYNGKQHLETYLDSVISHTPDYGKVVVVDNGSSDDSVQFIKSHFPKLELIEFEENYGFAGGYTKALKRIDSEYYFILNSDVEISKDCCDVAIEYLDNNRNVACCQPKILSYERPAYFEHAGAAGGFLDKDGFPFCRGRIFDYCEEDKGQYTDEMNIFWATGAAMFIRSEVFHKLGGFDPEFFAHMEEIDLCWRIQRAGHDIVVLPNIHVKHLGGGTLSYMSPFKTYLNFRNCLFMLHKNLKSGHLIRKMIKRLFLDGIAGLRFITRGEWKNFNAVLKAHYHYYRKIPYLNKQKKAFKRILGKHSLKKNLDGQYRGSIVVDYFLRGKNTFDKL